MEKGTARTSYVHMVIAVTAKNFVITDIAGHIGPLGIQYPRSESKTIDGTITGTVNEVL